MISTYALYRHIDIQICRDIDTVAAADAAKWAGAETAVAAVAAAAPVAAGAAVAAAAAAAAAVAAVVVAVVAPTAATCSSSSSNSSKQDTQIPEAECILTKGSGGACPRCHTPLLTLHCCCNPPS